MANRVIIRKKYRPPEAEQARAAKSQRGGRRQFLAKVTTQVTAATFDETNEELTLGKGKAIVMYREGGTNDSDKVVAVDEDVKFDIYNVTKTASADPEERFVLVWVVQSDTDGKFYYFEPCESFELQTTGS